MLMWWAGTKAKWCCADQMPMKPAIHAHSLTQNGARTELIGHQRSKTSFFTILAVALLSSPISAS